VPAMCSVGRHNTRLVPSHPPTVRRRANATVIVKFWLCLQVVAALPTRMRVGLLAFGAAVAAFDLTRAGVAAAHVSPGHFAASEATVAGLRARRAAHVVPLSACRGAVEAAIRSMRHASGLSITCSVACTQAACCFLERISGRHQATLPACAASERRCVCLGAGWTAEPMIHAIEQ